MSYGSVSQEVHETLAIAMNRLGAKFSETKWSDKREALMKYYIQQRYDTDPEFKQILDTVKSKNYQLVFYNGPKPSELGGLIREDGSVDGQNRLGELYMSVA